MELALGQGQLAAHPVFIQLELRRQGQSAVEHNAALEPLAVRVGQGRLTLEIIYLFDLVLRRNQPMTEVAVVGQQQQPDRVAVEPTAGKKPEPTAAVVEQLEHGVVARVVGRADIAVRLVEHDDDRGFVFNVLPAKGDADTFRVDVHIYALDRDARQL